MSLNVIIPNIQEEVLKVRTGEIMKGSWMKSSGHGEVVVHWNEDIVDESRLAPFPGAWVVYDDGKIDTISYRPDVIAWRVFNLVNEEIYE